MNKQLFFSRVAYGKKKVPKGSASHGTHEDEVKVKQGISVGLFAFNCTAANLIGSITVNI